MEEETKVSKDYKEAFNQGYEVVKELGLKPDALSGMNTGNNRIQAMKDGMEQYGKEIAFEKDKDIISPLDMDSLNDSHIDLTLENKDKDKDIDMD